MNILPAASNRHEAIPYCQTLRRPRAATRISVRGTMTNRRPAPVHVSTLLELVFPVISQTLSFAWERRV
jgi:hypothetical protein